MPDPATHRLNAEQREEITRRVLAGETAAALGREFGVTRAYVGLLKAQALDPERFQRKAEAKLSRKLTPSELGKFRETIAANTPETLGLIPAREHWTLDHGHQLAWNLFQKKVSVRVVTECLEPYLRKRGDFQFTKPQPPKKHHVNQLDPELAKDPDFVAYYLSPICEQIAWREYERALEDWENRFAETDARQEENPGAVPEPRMQPTGRRVGKHAKGKGSPFTPAKRRKKRR